MCFIFYKSTLRVGEFSGGVNFPGCSPGWNKIWVSAEHLPLADKHERGNQTEWWDQSIILRFPTTESNWLFHLERSENITFLEKLVGEWKISVNSRLQVTTYGAFIQEGQPTVPPHHRWHHQKRFCRSRSQTESTSTFDPRSSRSFVISFLIASFSKALFSCWDASSFSSRSVCLSSSFFNCSHWIKACQRKTGVKQGLWLCKKWEENETIKLQFYLKSLQLTVKPIRVILYLFVNTTQN